MRSPGFKPCLTTTRTPSSGSVWTGRETKYSGDFLTQTMTSFAVLRDKADIGTKHLIVSRLIERVEVRTGYKMHIKFKISLKQFLGQE